tara:strand:- start:17813 stop:18622 length:810 start_codon:yes stop_codon:yes gene_type:complete
MIRLVMQNNLISENDLGQVQQACLEAGAEVQEIIITPFSEDIPEFTYNRKNLYYGSTTLMYNIYNQLRKPLGLFYDHEKYLMSEYLHIWGDRMLNSNGLLMRLWIFFEEFDSYKGKFGNGKLFIRPNGDGKEFDGQVGTYEELKEMLERHVKYDNRLDNDSKILVSPAYNIFKEWRLYIVGGEIITSSRYRKDFQLSKSRDDAPEEMLQFARECMEIHMPHENFAMDIASTHDGEYYIIECGCLNSVGFYHADINKLFKAIVTWMEKQQ